MPSKRYFDTPAPAPLFRFAVLADTHMRPAEADQSPIWEVNKLANDRTRWVISNIVRAQPDFVIHVGDIVHPVPHRPTYAAAAAAALEAHSAIACPLYFIPGNHDVGDKHNPMMPADAVDDYGIEMYVKSFGHDYQSFDHKGIHFTLINCQLIGSALAGEASQAAWLEADLAANEGRRIFLFTHYPPFICEPDEPSYYDNLDEPGRTWLLELLLKYRVEALFAGHVHNFFYQRYGETECYSLLSTSFVRGDYADLFYVEPADQYGRNDSEKLGWCMVDVHEEIHIARIHRSYGSTLRLGTTLPGEKPRLPAPHTKDSIVSPVGVHLRDPWAESISLPFNGPEGEFFRRRVRNDYPLLSLWESGIRKLRVPLSDLVHPTVRVRMEALRDVGHQFTVFSLGVPDGADLETLVRFRNLIGTYEVILRWQDVSGQLQSLKRLVESMRIPVNLAPITTSANQKRVGSRFYHSVSFGFDISEMDVIDNFCNSVGADLGVGFVFRVAPGQSPWDSIQRLATFAQRRRIRIAANVQLGADNPAVSPRDDMAVASRVAECFVAGAAHDEVEVFLDTFIDHDRGFNPRQGLYDRRYNHHLGSYVLTHLQAFLNEAGPEVVLDAREEKDETIFCRFTVPKANCVVILPQAPSSRCIERIVISGTIRRNGRGRWIELRNGKIDIVEWKAEPDGSLSLGGNAMLSSPTLFVMSR